MKLYNSFTFWFKNTAVWWFTTLFGRLGILFFVAGFVLLFSAYYVFNWSFTESDNILDAHDAYYHYKLVNSWGSPPDTVRLQKELENLQLNCVIYYADLDTLCENDSLVYWSNWNNSPRPALCDYISYSDSEDLGQRHNIEFPSYVSFGDFFDGKDQYQATLVVESPFQYLLTIGYIDPANNFNVVPIVVLLFAFLLFLYLLVRRFLAPISLIEKRIVDLEGGDLDSKIKVVGSDELAKLSKNLNKLIDDIKNLLKQKERLLSEVSHELRSPLAKIRLLLAMIPPHRKIDKIDKQIKSLDSIITNILLSDKMSSPYSNLKLENAKIGDVIKQALELTFVKNVQVSIKNELSANIDVIKSAIAIKNLIENAYKYGPAESPIYVNAFEDKEFYNIEVVDSGPGIPETLQKEITKAFVRGPNRQTSGFGLGLSISNKVVMAHGGSLKLCNNKETPGVTITLCFPKK